MELTLTLIMATTTARGPLMLSPPPLPSPMLMPTTESMVMVWDTTVWATGATPMELTLTLIMASTTARGPLMLSPPPMLMPTTTEPMVWDTEDTLVCTTDTPDTLMLIMETTTAMVPGPTTATVWATTDTTVWATEPTGDKFSAVESTKQKLKANITPCYLT